MPQILKLASLPQEQLIRERKYYFPYQSGAAVMGGRTLSLIQDKG